MVPLGMEVKSFIQQLSNDSQDFQDFEIKKINTDLKKNKKEKKHGNSGHEKNEKIEEIVDFNSTINSAFSVSSRNSLPKVRQNNYHSEKKIPQNILSSKLLKPLTKSDALKIRRSR